MAKRGKRNPRWTPFEPGAAIELTGDPAIDTKESWVNSRYQVFVYHQLAGWADGAPEIVHLSIKRHDRACIHDWREFQRIKNELCGTDSEAVELYPAEGRKADVANQYHLFALPPGMRFPVGFDDGRITDEDEGVREEVTKQAEALGIPVGLSRQREWKPHHRSKDCPRVGPVWKRK
jgi:hypothetical protein